ncbi:MarR family winged helix-turn-helix transcriptional regulator [Promicromonospora sp. NPDC057138]|uniref:MarR family winged helix-turn-helix transcriptional regulator n=1 Tax=Promicromonospora sp. NPDC057138 TaxID=3346031 RepID=UPI00363BEFDD
MRAADLHRLARTIREIALRATENTGEDSVNAGQLAVLEDVARNPQSTIGEITHRTRLAQSLVSRIARDMADVGALTIEKDPADRRKVRVDLDARARRKILERAGNTIDDALSASTPSLTDDERRDLEHHLAEAERLLRTGADTATTVRRPAAAPPRHDAP